jgi:hypothetical protein
VELIPSGFSLPETNETFEPLLEVSSAQRRSSQLNAIIDPSVAKYLAGFPKPSTVLVVAVAFG